MSLKAMIGLLVLSLTINLFIAIKFASKAKKQGRDEGLWFLIVFLMPLLGAIVFLVTSKPIEREKANAKDSKKKKPITAVEEYIIDNEKTTCEEIRDNLYHEYPAGYPNKLDWWFNLILPKLKERCNIKNTKNTWEYRTNTEFEDEENGENTKFKHKKIDERSRGSLVLVSNHKKEGRFYISNEGINPESPRLRHKHGEEWVNDAQSYLMESVV